MSETRGEPQVRTRRGWLAFLLNLIVPPTGYLYVGSIRAAVILLVLTLAGGGLLVVWTIQNPPGLYADPLGLGAPAGLVALMAVVHLGVAIHAATMARTPRGGPSGWRLWLLTAVFLVVPAVLGELVKQFGPISFYAAASDSMQPSLAEGDVVAVRGARAICGRVDPQPGDVIIYRRRQDPDGAPWLKRVVAVGGQIVEMHGGRLVIDGAPVPAVATGRTFEAGFGPSGPILRETLANGASYRIADTGDSDVDAFGPARVPKGSVFVMGDNRDNSIDSRVDGPVAVSDVCSIVFRVMQASDRRRIGRRP